jgi:hypothetical protein
MDIKSQLRRGRKAVDRAIAAKQKPIKEKKPPKTKLITCWVTEELREEAIRKCPNLSEFIRVCLQRLVDSPIEKQINKIYEGVADSAIEHGLGGCSQSKTGNMDLPVK